MSDFPTPGGPDLLEAMTWIRCRAAALITTTLTTVLAGYLIPGGPAVAGTRSPLAIPNAVEGVPVTLRFGSHVAVYDDLGLPVPAPGLARIGVVDTGLDRLACAGEEIELRIELPATEKEPR